MARSDSSDNGRGRKHSKSKKKTRHRSPSDSSSSDRGHKHKSRYRSDERKHKSDERRRSRSRERRKSRSHERNRSPTRSRSHERYRSRSRSHSRERKRSRSVSRERSRKARDEHIGKSYESKSHAKQNSSKESSRVRSYDSPSKSNVAQHLKENRFDDQLSLKEKIKLLVGKTVSEESAVMPSSEQIANIENENFLQQKFSSTYVDPSAMPKQKKKKKPKQKQKEEIKVEIKEEVAAPDAPLISHEDAIFGNSLETLHVARFSSRIDGKRKEELKNVEVDDVIFGAMFFDKPEVRKKRWIKKLTAIREKLLAE